MQTESYRELLIALLSDHLSASWYRISERSLRYSRVAASMIMRMTAALVLKFIRIVLRNTIKYWGMPLLGALLWLGFSWFSYGTLLWPEALLVFLIVFMLNYALLEMRKLGRGKYSHVVN